MSKELSPLEALNYFLEKQDRLEKYGSSGGFSISEQREKLNIIEAALKHLEVLERELCVVKTMEDLIIEAMKDKRLKALDIIKKRCPYISLEKRKHIDDDKPYVLIIGGGYDTAYIELTKEEYEILKEVLL